MEKKEIKMEEKKAIQDNFHRFVEMNEAMLNSIENAKTIKLQQEELINFLIKNDKQEKFIEFTKELKEGKEKLDTQIKTLTKRQQLLDELLKQCEKKENKDLIQLFVNALGMFE